MAPAKTENYAYVTLITKSSYLAGVIILAYTLKRAGSKYPLVVLYTDGCPASTVEALNLESEKLNLVVKKTEALLPRKDLKINLIAERFGDTWTKLRVFELFEYDKVCYLDADMTIRHDMDEIFDVEIPKDWIAASHACVCNLDKDPWAPDDWVKENCAFTPVQHPDALTHPTQVHPDSRGTYHLLNSGMFLFYPSKGLWDQMLSFFNTTPKLAEYKFPDQDFLGDFFHNRWKAVGWQYNAIKTMPYWHPNIWRDDSVCCLHYIVDKPWAKRVGEDGVAGYLGRDGKTHTWWWEDWESWVAEREGDEQGKKALAIIKNHVAKPIGEEGEESEEMKAIGSQVQAFAKNGEKKE